MVSGFGNTMVIKRVGGKSKIAGWIAENLPPATIFVDVFGGSGAVLDALLERRAKVRRLPKVRLVYNDLDPKLHVFFRILRDHKNALAHLTALTPYSRRMFNDADSLFRDKVRFEKLEDLDKALVFLVVNRQCYGSKMDGTWSITRDGEINYETWGRLPKYILKVAKRWKNVFLENLDYEELIKKWDDKKTTFYLDPPYEGVEENYYEVNKEDGFDHQHMLDVLKQIKGSFCVSYYGGAKNSGDTDLIRAYTSIGCSVVRKGVFKHLAKSETKEKATEVLLIKNSSGRKLGQKGIYDDD